MSTTVNDVVCAACPDGQFAPLPHAGTHCRTKNVTFCGPGFYFYTNHSRAVDDNECLQCPSGTYSSLLGSALATCRPKHPIYCRDKNEFTHFGVSRTSNDNYCVVVGECAPGYAVAADGGCRACTHGRYSVGFSNKTTCKRKHMHRCPPGQHVQLGTSATHNDARCIDCPHGSYNSGSTSSFCTFKGPHSSTCPSGYHVGAYTSTVHDDSACHLCPPGQYNDVTAKANNKIACKPKTLPQVCSSGQHRSLGNSTRINDWQCLQCSPGQFTDRSNTYRRCTHKTRQSDCRGGVEVLVRTNDSVTTEDSTCQPRGLCKPGRQVASDNATCVPCRAGRFNPVTTTSRTACQNKTRPDGCAAGQRLVLGGSLERNDWRCTPCLPGYYRSTSFLVHWPDRHLHGAEASADQTTCVPKAVPPKCSEQDPSTSLHRGKSVYRDDWHCRPNAVAVALCQKRYRATTRSSLRQVMIGMPELVMPFTKRYYASVRTPGLPSCLFCLFCLFWNHILLAPPRARYAVVHPPAPWFALGGLIHVSCCWMKTWRTVLHCC